MMPTDVNKGLTDYLKEGSTSFLDVCRAIELESGDTDRALDEMKSVGAILLQSSEL